MFKLDKFVLSKSRMYVGKGYISGGMWKLNVMTIIKSEILQCDTWYSYTPLQYHVLYTLSGRGVTKSSLLRNISSLK